MSRLEIGRSCSGSQRHDGRGRGSTQATGFVRMYWLEVCRMQAVHIHFALAVRQAAFDPQEGQTKPSGHRNCSKYSKQAWLSGNYDWSS